MTSLKVISPPGLALYDPNKALKLSADASSYRLGVVLLQRERDGWKPVAYTSRSMTDTEQRYAQVGKEALGLTWGCERFRDFLIGRHSAMETDHKPLVSLLGHQALTSTQNPAVSTQTHEVQLHNLPHTQSPFHSRCTLMVTCQPKPKFKTDGQEPNGRDKHLRG